MQLILEKNNTVTRYNVRTRSFEKPAEQPNKLAFVELKDANAVEELKAEGVEVLKVRGNIAIVSVPTSNVEKVSNLECVKRMQLAQQVSQKMNRVRTEIGVDKIPSRY